MAALSQAINSINVEQASESDMIKQKSQDWGWGEGKGQKSIFVVNASKKGAELLDKDITPLHSCLFVFLLLFCLLSLYVGLSARGTAAFPDHKVKAVRKPGTSETETCQSNKPCQGTAKPHHAPHAAVYML